MIRPYKNADLKQVVELFCRSVREVARRDYSTEQIDAWAPELPDWSAWEERLQNGHVFVYEFAGEVMGFVKFDDRGYLDLLFVHPAYQRQGVARALMELVIGCSASPVLTAEVSLTARPLFEHLGFIVVHEQEVDRSGVTLRNFKMKRERSSDPSDV